MMEEKNRAESRPERYGKTERKHVTLLPETVEVVQAYAERHRLNFSVAIETLVQTGLGQTTAETMPRLVASQLERIVNRQFNRFAKLLAMTAITAKELDYKADVLLLQMIWREAREDAAEFPTRLEVSTDPEEQPAALAREIRDAIRTLAHQDAVVAIQKPVQEIGSLWEVVAKGVDDEEG
jgi:hypothetical protein